MKTLTFKKEEPKLKIELPDGSEMILTRRFISIENIEEFDAQLLEMVRQVNSGEISNLNYVFRVIDHVCEGFEPEKLNKLNSHALQDIAQAVLELRRESALEKKSG